MGALSESFEKLSNLLWYFGYTTNEEIKDSLMKLETEVRKLETVNDILNKEMVVFIVKPSETEHDHSYWFDADDDEFKVEAERQERIYSLDYFQSCFNNNDSINQNEDLIRFIKVSSEYVNTANVQ